MKLHITVDNATYEVDVEVADDIRPQPLPLAFDTAKMSVPVAPPAGAPTASSPRSAKRSSRVTCSSYSRP